MALRLAGDAEAGFWGLVRGGLAAGGALARIAEALHDRLRPHPPAPVERPQLSLWVIDAEGLPPRPWRLAPDARFDCLALGCRGMLATTCVARQRASEIQRTQQASRGQGTDYPGCDTRRCAQGRGIREALDPAVMRTLRGSGPGGRFKMRSQERSTVTAQLAARAKAELEGRLDHVRVLDVDPDPGPVEG